MAFDRDGQPLWGLEAPYAKIVPLAFSSRMATSGPGVVVLLRALDRLDTNRRWEPVTWGMGQSAPETAQIALTVSWDDFILLSEIRRGISTLSPAELKRAAENLEAYGNKPAVFYVELLRRFTEPLLLLPLGVLAIILGWRYRALKRPRYMAYLMLCAMPLIFSAAINLSRSWINGLAILAVASVGFTVAAVFFAAGIMVLLVSFLIILAAQHG